ncbi:unnamed protein product, partial [Ectocarpus sp. 6 AP-2014]
SQVQPHPRLGRMQVHGWYRIMHESRRLRTQPCQQ